MKEYPKAIGPLYSLSSGLVAEEEEEEEEDEDEDDDELEEDEEVEGLLSVLAVSAFAAS
jgi:hypothetical protein